MSEIGCLRRVLSIEKGYMHACVVAYMAWIQAAAILKRVIITQNIRNRLAQNYTLMQQTVNNCYN